MNETTTHAFVTTLTREQLPEALKKIPSTCGHHVLDNGDGTVVLSVWSE